MRIVTSAVLFLSVLAVGVVFLGQEETIPDTTPGAEPPPEETTPEMPAFPPEGTTPEVPTPMPAPTGGEVAPREIPPTVTPLTQPTIGRTAPLLSGEELIPFTFENTQLSTIIKLVAESTGRNFLIQTPIAGTVLIYCPKKIAANMAFDILGIILDSQGYTMAMSEDPPLVYVTKKTGTPPGMESIPTEILVEKEGGPQKKHELATMIVVLNYVSVDDMQNILRNFKSPSGVMTAYPAGNFLILKDDQATLEYLLSIIKKIDVPGTASKVTLVELKYADATETATLLTNLMSERAGGQLAAPIRVPPTPTLPGAPAARPITISPVTVGGATPLRIFPETRTNRLVILASEKDTEYVLELVKKLDVEPTEEMYPIRTYIAQYQNAEDLADTLASFVTGQERARTRREARTLTSRQQRTARRVGRQAAAPAAAGPAALTPAMAGPVAGGAEEAFFLADPATNMVLIQAPPQKVDMYLTLLKELDQPQKQLLLEVWVVEISSKSQLDIGVEFKSAEIGPAERVGPMQDEIFGGTNFDLGLGNLLSGTGYPTSGVSMGIRSLTNTRLEAGGKVYYIPNFDTFIRALREDTQFNILSSPKLTAMNNEKAIVEVTDEISIAESAITSFATAQAQAVLPGGYTETYSREPVGIILEITPQINSENSVIMEIELEVGSIAGVEDITQAGTRPVIASRYTFTKVRVDNGRTIVISGLRRSDKTKTTTRVPIIGQIPILGLLFSHDKTLTVNTNLLVFITPHIVSDTLDMLEVTDALKNQDLEKERPRFQPTRRTRAPGAARVERAPGWAWKK